MDNTCEIDTKTENDNSTKKVIVVISDKNINNLTLGYLNQNKEFDNIIIENNCDKEAVFSEGDFLVYDGEKLYTLEGDKLISLNNYEKLTIGKTAIKNLKDAAYALYNEIINFRNKTNGRFLKTKKLISN